jgi:tRNA-modifying protein YgfZ
MTTPADDLLDDYRALTEGCGLADRSATPSAGPSTPGRLEMLGADRQRFLNAYITCDVKALAPGDGAYGFFTSAQGRILSDAVVLAHPDRLWLEVGAGQEEALAGHLRKFVIVDRVEIRPLADMLPLTLVGPRAAEVLGSAAEKLPDGLWKHARVMVDGTEVTLQRTGRMGAPAFTLWVSASIAPHLAEALLARGGVRRVGEEALEVLRVEAGIPRFGRDFGPDNFPQETGEDDAVSYTKGCYLGQEVVARIHYRGGVQKRLCRLKLDHIPRLGAQLLFEGREVGAVTSAVESPAQGGPIGLGIVHKRAAEPGTRLEVEGGGTAVPAAPAIPTP